jgi:hypothetical protein
LTGTKTLSGLVEPFFNSVERSLRAQFDGIPRATRQFALAAVDLIRARTLRGQFLNEGAKKTYSPAYAKRKGREGTVTLAQTGQMIRALKVEGDSSGLRFDPAGRGSVFRASTGRFAAIPATTIESIIVDDTPRSEKRKTPRTNEQIARFHDSAIGRTSFPRRQFLGLTPEESDGLYRKVFSVIVEETGTPPRPSSMTIKLSL